MSEQQHAENVKAACGMVIHTHAGQPPTFEIDWEAGWYDQERIGDVMRHAFAAHVACAGIPTDALAPGSVAALIEALDKCRQHVADTRDWRPHADLSEGKLPFGTTDYYHMDELIAEAGKALAPFKAVQR